MRERYPANQNRLVDQEDADHNLIPGEWRDTAKVEQVIAPNRDTKAAKQQREYLRLYLSSAAGSVSWQDRMIDK